MMARRFGQAHASDVIIGDWPCWRMPRGEWFSRIKIVRSCSINAPWNSGIGILSGRFASSRPKLDRRFQAEDFRSEGAMFGPKITVWAEGGITFGPGRRTARGSWGVQLMGF
ncbi:hypothetical protein ACFX1S_010328 [Malus domestica]